MEEVHNIGQISAVTVFGSSIIRVEPDIASLRLSVSRLDQQAKDAFRAVHEAVQQVRTYLVEAKVDDVRISRIGLSEAFRYSGSEEIFLGYRAGVEFHILLHNLDRTEEILLGAIDAGTNKISSVELHTSRLKEFRAEARQRAVEAAREKAEIYCKTAGVSLGSVIYIEDVNPDTLGGREGHYHVAHTVQPDYTEPMRAFDPRSIIVGGAVKITFRLE